MDIQFHLLYDVHVLFVLLSQLGDCTYISIWVSLFISTTTRLIPRQKEANQLLKQLPTQLEINTLVLLEQGNRVLHDIIHLIVPRELDAQPL